MQVLGANPEPSAGAGRTLNEGAISPAVLSSVDRMTIIENFTHLMARSHRNPLKRTGHYFSGSYIKLVPLKLFCNSSVC